MSLTCIGSKRGQNTGIVFDADQRRLGRVFRTTRRLRADMGGGTGTAWTANVMLPDGTEIGGSLGTRHADRWAAARAIRAFWDMHLDLWDAAMADPQVGDWYSPLNRQINRAVAIFKYDRHEICGLLARYRGGDPRKGWGFQAAGNQRAAA